MVESLPPVPDFVTSKELEEGIVSGRITTFTVTEENLPDYQNAANAETRFKVEVIAMPGQHYVTEQIKPINRRRSTSGQSNTPIITAVKSTFPVRKGSVAIFLERPEGVTNDMDFNRARQHAEQIRLQKEERAAKKKT